MSTDSVPERVRIWRDWIHEDLRHEVVGMYVRRQMWRGINDILLANPSVGQLPSSYWHFHHDNYAAAQAIAIRRQADNTRNVRSLWRLLAELTGDPDLLTRESYVALLDEFQAQDDLLVKRANEDWDRWSDNAGRRFNGEIARADQRELERATQRVKDYVDQHVAHDQHNPTAAIPTFEELHEAIDVIAAKFQKYAAILTGAYWALDHMIQDNWKTVFRRAWID
jgi:hypothetical protein